MNADYYSVLRNMFDINVEHYHSWYERNIDKSTLEEYLVRSFKLGGRAGVEIGSGTCFFTRLFRNCIGIDLSFNMCLKCRNLYNDIDVINCIGEMLPIRNSSLDYAVIIVTICFIDDYEKVIKEIRRCLKKNSKLLICIVPRESSIGRKYVEKRMIGNTTFYTLANLFTSGDIVYLMLREGFDLVDVRSTLCDEKGDCGFRCLLFTRSV